MNNVYCRTPLEDFSGGILNPGILDSYPYHTREISRYRNCYRRSLMIPESKGLGRLGDRLSADSEPPSSPASSSPERQSIDHVYYTYDSETSATSREKEQV